MNHQQDLLANAESGGGSAMQHMAKILERVELKKRKAEKELEAAGYTAEIIEKTVQEHDELVQQAHAIAAKSDGSQRGVAALRVIERAQLQLIELERRGDFEQMVLNPGREYPTLFTRVPIFLPARRKVSRELLDKDGGLTFQTGWGEGRKFGPQLSIYDEDTLLALGALRQLQLCGHGDKLPIHVSNPFKPNDPSRVHVLYTTISAIEEYLGNAKGGRGHKKRLASVKRLANVVLELTRISDKNLDPIIKARSFSTKIIDMVTEESRSDSCLYIQFPPVMVYFLCEQYTYIDMDIRRQLRGDYAKSIHKFLSGQQTFRIRVEKLRTEMVQFAGRPKKFNEILRDALEQLKALNWLKYEISGTGRNSPYILKGELLKTSKGK